MYGKTSTIILIKKLDKFEDYLSFYGCLTFFKSKELKIETAFGIFLGINLELIRKKIKNNFLNELKTDNILFLLESANREAYYENQRETESIIGIEIRQKREVPTEEEASKDLLGILGELKKTEKKYR